MRTGLDRRGGRSAAARARRPAADGRLRGRRSQYRAGGQDQARSICSAWTAPESIGLLRELRAGAIPRADSRLPVLVVGADDDSAAVRYYRAGADVALPTRSSPLLVAAGLEALARRTAGEHERRRMLRVGSLTVDCDARVAEIDHRPVNLSRLEFDLLQTLATQPRKTFTRADSPDRCGNMTPRPPAPRAPWTATPTGCATSSSRPAPSRSCKTSAAWGGG